MEKKIMRKPEIKKQIGISDATLSRWEKAGDFPRRIQLGGNSVGWLESEIEDWLEKKADRR